MTKKEEMATLRELARIHQNSAERAATYRRCRWGLLVTGGILVFTAFLLCSFENVSSELCSGIAMLGGGLCGLSILYSLSVKQVPLLVRYSTLHAEEVQKRLEELNNA